MGPVVRGMVERRLVGCYACEPADVARALPDGLQPFDVDGRAIATVVLEWWRDVRPGFLPSFFGGSPARALHRIVVAGSGPDGRPAPCSWSVRIDSTSPFGAWLEDGRWSELARPARIELEDEHACLDATMVSHDGRVHVDFAGRRGEARRGAGRFETAGAFERFWERTARPCRLRNGRAIAGPPDRARLGWEPLAVERDVVSLFDDPELFGSCRFELDSAWIGSALARESSPHAQRDHAPGGAPLALQPTLHPAP